MIIYLNYYYFIILINSFNAKKQNKTKKKQTNKQTNKQNESIKLRKLACTLPNQLYFQYFILLLFSKVLKHVPFIES